MEGSRGHGGRGLAVGEVYGVKFQRLLPYTNHFRSNVAVAPTQCSCPINKTRYTHTHTGVDTHTHSETQHYYTYAALNFCFVLPTFWHTYTHSHKMLWLLLLLSLLSLLLLLLLLMLCLVHTVVQSTFNLLYKYYICNLQCIHLRNLRAQFSQHLHKHFTDFFHME